MLETFSQSIWLVPLYAILGGVLALPWSPGIIRKTGPRPAGYINVIFTLIAFVHSILAMGAVWKHAPVHNSFHWLQAANLNIFFEIEISSVTIGALILITGLNLAAQIFAIGYMEMDWGWARFYSLLALFDAGMCTLVICDSLFFSYMVLEVLTLGTYLLIGLWFNQSLVVTGARDAFLTKRIGDLILLMGVVSLLPLAGTWNFDKLAVWAANAKLDPTVATLLTLSLIAGPLGKCAQFPLHLWLDEAMEGPLPATVLRNTVVVSTGAWLLYKLQPVLALSPFTTNVMIWIGGLTAVGASLIAIAQIDVKRSLSYTVSAYMGLVFITVATNQEQTALALILTYSIAMAILVMTVGGVVWNNITQDLTQYGGLWSRRPVSGICYLIGAASIVALPPFGSFWALAQIGSNLSKSAPLLLGILLVVNGLTAFSVGREFCLIFGGKPKLMTTRSPEALWPLVVPNTIMAGLALHMPLVLGYFGLLPKNLNSTVVVLLIASTAIGAASSAYVYLSGKVALPVRLEPKALQDFFAYDLYTAKLYKMTVVFVVDWISQIINWFDRYLVDGVVNFVGLFTVFSGQTLKYNVSGQTQFYALSIILGIALLGVVICWPLLSNIGLT